MSCLIIHVHGFGGEDYNESFISLVRKFAKKIHLENKIFATTYTWDSEKLSTNIIGKNWTRAQEKAEQEVANFIVKLFDYSKQYDSIYISAFSLGTKVVSMAIKQIKILPQNLKGIFFLGSALEKDFRFEKILPFKIINYYSDNNDKVLKNVYKAMEAKSAGGEVGFLDNKNFLNLYTNCSHAIFYRNYKKYIPQIIVSFIAFWNNIQIENKQLPSVQSSEKKIKIKINEKRMNKILVIDNIAIYQTLPKFQKEKYFVADLEKDKNYAYSFPESSSNLIKLLKEHDITYDRILNKDYESNHSIAQEPIKKQNTTKQSNIENLREKIYPTIFNTPIINTNNPKKSFYIKFIYKLPIKKVYFDDFDNIKNFKRFTKKTSTSYFSKLEIETNDKFRDFTSDILVWKESDNIKLPLIYNFDFSFFKNNNVLELTFPKTKTDCKITLKDIDLIPTKNHSYLAFTVMGSTISIEDYLNIVSNHLFGKVFIKKTGNKELDNIRITFSGLKEYIQRSILTSNDVDIAILSKKSSEERPLIMQYLLLESKLGNLNTDILASTVKLLGTCSRPNVNYPKIEPHIWQSEQALETIYTNFKNYGTSAICSSTDEFNRNNKPAIFMKANYFQKILSEEITDKEKREIIKMSFKEKVRQEMFKNMLI